MRFLSDAEDMMKLLEGVIVKAVEASKVVKDLTNSVSELATATETLAKNVAVLAHNQHVHHQMIGRLWVTQQAMLKKMSEGAVSLALPTLNGAGKDGKKDADKPN